MQKLIADKSSHHIDWDGFETDYLNFYKRQVLRKLSRLSPRLPIRKKILKYFNDQIDDILIGDPDKLELLIKKFSQLKVAGISYNRYIKENTSFRSTITKIFNYKKLREDYGYKLGSAIGIKACPYCNSQFVLVLVKDEKAAFHFDHFFPKRHFPYLGISLYNLIPSCYHCNHQKSDTRYSTKQLLHPYKDGFYKVATFKTEPSSIIKFLTVPKTKSDEITLSLSLSKKFSITDSEKKLKNHKKTFLLDGIYENHKDIAGDIYIKAKTYNKSLRKELKRLARIAGINLLTDSDIDRLILGNYTNEGNINSRPLSKLSIDIAKESKLIK